MTVPISATPVNKIYEQLQDSAVNVQSYLNNVSAQINAGTVSPTDYLAALNACSGLLVVSDGVAGNATLVANLVNYANLVVPGQTFTATSLSASITALSALVTAMVAAYPVDANGHLLDRTFGAGGAISWVPLSGSNLTQVALAIAAYQATLS